MKNQFNPAVLTPPERTAKTILQRAFSTACPLFLVGTMLALAACERSPVDPVKLPDDTGSVPIDSTNHGPGSGDSTVTNPGKPTTPVPVDSGRTQPTDPIDVFKKMTITWAPSDFQELRMDAAGTPLQYTSQYLFNQGTGDVKRTVYRFTHDAGQRLIRLDRAGTGYVLYHYEGNQVAYTEEYTPSGERLKLHTYRYSAANQLIQVDTENRMNRLSEMRSTYQYDNRGNLTVQSDFVKNASGSYALEMTFHFEDYDDGRHVENLLTVFPYLPSVTFRVNNYGTKIVRFRDGKEINRETFAYAYNRQGEPIQKTCNGAGGTLTAAYSY